MHGVVTRLLLQIIGDVNDQQLISVESCAHVGFIWSFSGSANLVREGGEDVNLLTDPWMSPLDLEADSVLSAAVDGSSPFDSQVVTVGIIETLISGVVDYIGDKARRRITDYDNLWDAQGFHYIEEKSDYEVGDT